MNRLVDPVCGVIRKVTPYPRLPGMPDAYRCMIAEVADTRRVGVWLADRIAAGTSFGDAEAARRGAIGEAVERYCGNNIPDDLPRASAADLAARGVAHLGPGDLPGHSAGQHARDGFPYRPWSADEPILWARGTGTDGAPVLVPGSWTYLNWHQGPRRDEPRHHHLNYAGIACGQGLTDASARALTEVVERDAVTLWWGLALPARGVRVASVPGLPDAWRGSDLALHLVEVPNDFGTPVIAALAFDAGRRIAAAGFACRRDPVAACHKAAQEAVQVWIAALSLLAEDGAAFDAMARGVLARHSYLPFRADRRYLDAAGEDFSAVRDLAAQAQVWLDERLHPLLDRFTRPGSEVDVAQIPSGGDLAQAVTATGRRVVTVDLTTTDIAETGLAVARVAVDGLLPNSPAAYPLLGSVRWKDVAARHGADGTITSAPIPHL
ncbi:YcaO-like family protein [Actinomadura hibisca]|uniref:YcaO-like family protein n=1 Tax=Actinomadura hibisca TaxID=68565 RepID=UPI000830F7CA|nr:YcaO-like family protein [Actinomadura hibisca]